MSGNNPFELDTIDTDADAGKLQASTVHIGDSLNLFPPGGNADSDPFATTQSEDGMKAHNVEEQSNDNIKKVDGALSTGEVQDNLALGNTGLQNSIPGPTGDLVTDIFVHAKTAPDPTPEQEAQAVSRVVTFWRNGFQFQDGELRRYDDPLQTRILAEINAGSAPTSVLNVLPGQLVELRVMKRTDEDYVPPKVATPPTVVATTSQPQGKKTSTSMNLPKRTNPDRRGKPNNHESGSKWTIQSVLQYIGLS